MTTVYPALSRDDARKFSAIRSASGSSAAMAAFPKFRLIDPEAASILFRNRGDLAAGCISELSAESARACITQLCSNRGPDEKRLGLTLALNSLESIDADTATALAHEGISTLSLNGLRALPEDAAAALSRLPRGKLQLDGLVSVTAGAFAALVSTSEGVSMRGLLHIDFGEAKAFSTLPRLYGATSVFWELNLDKLQYLPRVWADRIGEIARGCRQEEKWQGEGSCSYYIGLQELRVLNSAIFAEEAQYALYGRRREYGCLWIEPDKIEVVTLDALQALAKSKCFTDSIDLPALSWICPEMADTLVENCQSILLNGLTDLSEATAACFTTFEGETLSLDGIKQLSDAAFESLAACYASNLCLRGLNTLTAGQKRMLQTTNCRKITLSSKIAEK